MSQEYCRELSQVLKIKQPGKMYLTGEVPEKKKREKKSTNRTKLEKTWPIPFNLPLHSPLVQAEGRKVCSQWVGKKTGLL